MAPIAITTEERQFGLERDGGPANAERTPWLRTPDGVPVRIDWLVLAPRVGAVVGGWWLLGRLVGRLLG